MLFGGLPVEQVRPWLDAACAGRLGQRAVPVRRGGAEDPGAGSRKFAIANRLFPGGLAHRAAFHSADDGRVVGRAFLEAVRAVKGSPPTLPILSTVTRPG